MADRPQKTGPARPQDTAQVPRGRNIAYRCIRCGAEVPSVPKDSIGCRCGNIFIDIDYVRLIVEDFNHLEIIQTRTDTRVCKPRSQHRR